VTPRAPVRSGSLAARLLAAQVLVIVVGALSLAVTAALIAPGLFRRHLAGAEVAEPAARHHAEEAFASAFAVSLTVAALAALLTAGVASWFVVRKLTRPVEQLAVAAHAVAAGQYEVSVPAVPFSSELQQLSDAFAHMADQLADTDSARTRLLSDLAHELRTPLATLTAYVDGLEDGVVASDVLAWETMRAQIRRMQRLARDVRDVAIAEESALQLHTSLVDLVALTRDAVTAATPRFAERGVRLSLQVDGEVPLVPGDPDRLAQVLGNLLDNALRHTARAGHVDVAVSAAGQDGTTSVIVRVTDNGAGIPVDQLDAIFERFHRVDPARLDTDGGGSGLGLTIARAIVNAHHGTLAATSDGPGTGAVFTMRLPG
jgi:signal transduction histidine kinase